MNSQKQELTQQTVMRLSQQQLRFVRLLEMNAPELEEAVDRELEDNPALETAEEDHTRRDEEERRIPFFQRQPAAEERPFTPVDNTATIYDDLTTQLSERTLSPEVRKAALFIIGSLDSNGYLRTPLDQLVDDMAFGPGIMVSEKEAQEALNTVRSLEPAGIGARDLRDCLEIQLHALPPSPEREDALEIMEQAYEDFILKHRHKIISLLGMDEERAAKAIDLIRSLNPKPGAALGNDADFATRTIIPDVSVTNEDGQLRIHLNARIPELRIETSFESALRDLERLPKGEARKGSEFIVSRYNDARDFIRAVTQRQETLLKVITAIVSIQKDYFLSEDVYQLRPMMIKNVAAMTGLDLSVISRATNNKYIATPNGAVLPLRFFFSDTKGEEKEGTSSATNRKIEAEIKKLVDKEDKLHPLSDRKIQEEMLGRGYDLSRRTVAKYRDRIGIPVARLRKNL